MEKARSEFAPLSEEHPSDLSVKRRYVELLTQNKQFDQAMRLNETILKQNAKDAASLLLKGRLLDLEQKSSEAVSVLETAVESDPGNPWAHLELGVAYFRTSNFANAEKEWGEAAKLKPDLLEAWQDLSTLALRKADTRLLEDSASELLKYPAAAPKRYLLRGTAGVKKGDTQGAEADLRKAIELDPNNAKVHVRLGNLHPSQKRYAKAEKFYESALPNDPNISDGLQGLVAVFLAEKQPEKALRRVQTQIALVPNRSTYQLLLGETLVANHRAADGEKPLERAIELDRNNVDTYLIHAQLQDAGGQHEVAADTYNWVIQDNPGDARPYLSLGVLEEARGNWQKAEELYKKVLVIHPDQPVAANNLSYRLNGHGGDLNHALSLAQIARRGMPDSPNSADTLASATTKWACMKMRFLCSKRPPKNVPQNATYFYQLELAYQKSSKVELANESFQRALQLDPKSQRADDIR